MFDRPDKGERAILVHIHLQRRDTDRVSEFASLARAGGVDAVAAVEVLRDRPDARFFIGSGKVEEVAALVAEHEAQVVLFDHSLSPSQERDLEKALRCRVLDRAGLILDIFAQRARSHEGKLQVELAQLQHLSTRLIRGWTHLERQKGGIGLRGPGETQLETDRRLLRVRVRQLNARLAKVKQHRGLSRQSRKRAPVPTASLVGYTNAGKSTLFNKLTGAEVLAQDMLFATLDPTIRKLQLAGGVQCALVDTVGFVRDLPHALVEAFHATLQETAEADVLVHVIDFSDPDWRDRAADVEQVLVQLGLEDTPVLRVFNKIDTMADTLGDVSEALLHQQPEQLPEQVTEESAVQYHGQVWVSAHSGQGIEAFREALRELLAPDMVTGELVLDAHQGALRAALYRDNTVVSERVETDTGKTYLSIRAEQKIWARLSARFGVDTAVLGQV